MISLTTLHNLRVFELQTALQEINRVGKNEYVMVESYRNERELFNLECWALTADRPSTLQNGSGYTITSAIAVITSSSILSEG